MASFLALLVLDVTLKHLANCCFFRDYLLISYLLNAPNSAQRWNFLVGKPGAGLLDFNLQQHVDAKAACATCVRVVCGSNR